MFRVVLATVPVIAASVYFFGWRALSVIALSVVAASFVEWLFCRARKEPVSSAVFVTAILYALTLPPRVPYHVVLVGIVVAVMFGKEVFGGYARNIFNPALVGRCFVYVCFPIDMTSHWLAPYAAWPGGLAHWAGAADAFTRATPLTVFKSEHVGESLTSLLFGNTGGSLGETSALLIALGRRLHDVDEDGELAHHGRLPAGGCGDERVLQRGGQHGGAGAGLHGAGRRVHVRRGLHGDRPDLGRADEPGTLGLRRRRLAC